jgi:hypothetical protein
VQTERFVRVNGDYISFMMTETSDGAYAVNCPQVERFYASSVLEAEDTIWEALHEEPDRIGQRVVWTMPPVEG